MANGRATGGGRGPTSRSRSGSQGKSAGQASSGRVGTGALQRTQSALLNPDQLAAVVSMLQVLQGQSSGQSPDVGTLPSNFGSGGFATTSGEIPVGRVGRNTLGGLPFTPNPIAQGIASVGTLFANTRAAQSEARRRRQARERQRVIDAMTRRVLGVLSGGR